ncbi:gamma-glutamyl-gamma-aminobutyrate hydrolase family protein [Nocardia sp. NPDC004860]|uniref:gamma-glutamyl-gamma-aminobutyrate hydrolase family protein n=1 Tax=Nocardia sp. NPDC004860 TaxID=3154557 RepID=UPI0033ADAA8E
MEALDAATRLPASGMMATPRTPLIGVTGMWSNRVHGLRFDGNAVAVQVLKSVVSAGGEPLILFAESALLAPDRVRMLDGILIPGGADLRPQTYGATAHPETVPADYEGQDAFEAEILRVAIEEGVPVLAICRGFQLFNVISGGTLNQHLGDDDNPHRNSVHGVELIAGTVLHRVLGVDRIDVSSYHHQAVDQVADDLIVSARASDGVVEGLEHPTGEVVAVQWHPEDTAAQEPHQQALFDWLVGRARERRRTRTGAPVAVNSR